MFPGTCSGVGGAAGLSSENGVPLGDGHQRGKGPGAGAGAAEAGREVAGAASGTGAKSSRPAIAIDSPDGGAGGAGGAGQAPA